MNGRGVYTKSWVIRLIIINIAIHFIQILTMQVGVGDPPVSASLLMTEYLGLKPKLVIESGYIWQLFTYMFLHGGFFHLFLNMYALLIFGMPVEQAWGSRRFLFYYFFTGIGAGAVIFIINLIVGGAYSISTIGASGAVFGLLLAFGMLFPEAEILLFFLIPIKARLLVILYGGLELYSLIASGGQSPISHAGHLGGLIFGIVYFLIIRKRGITFKSKVIKAKLSREMDRRQQNETDRVNHEALLRSILRKVESGGGSTLTDDEFQYVRYMEIMTQDRDFPCDDGDFDPDDDYCGRCETREACLVRRIKKHL